ALVGREHLAQLLLHEGSDVAGDFLVVKGLADPLDDLVRGGGAHVGEIEPFFELVEETLIDASAQAEEGRDAGKDATRLGEAPLDLAEDCTKNHRGPQARARPRSVANSASLTVQDPTVRRACSGP